MSVGTSQAVFYRDSTTDWHYLPRSWDDIPDPHRSRLESFLGDDEPRPWLIRPMGRGTFAATEDSLILIANTKIEEDVRRQGRRFSITGINDLHPGGIFHRHVVFTYEGTRVEIKADLVFWILVSHFPQLAPSIVVQPDEVPAAIAAGGVKTIEIGCLISAREEERKPDFFDTPGVAGSAQYAPTQHDIVIRVGANKPYHQKLSCPVCGQELWVEVKGKRVHPGRGLSVMQDGLHLDATIKDKVTAAAHGTAQVAFPRHKLMSG